MEWLSRAFHHLARSFLPDGLVVLEGPEPGFCTDTKVWRDCNIRQQLEVIMQNRLLAGQRRLKLYADKIYNSCSLVTAAWNLRHGSLLPWMSEENFAMSKIRVAIEWTFGHVLKLFKFLSLKTAQKIFESPVAKHYVAATLLANYRNCQYGDSVSPEYFDCQPITLLGRVSKFVLCFNFPYLSFCTLLTYKLR